MAWTNSKIFTAYIQNILSNTTAMDVESDAWKAALFDNSITPSQVVSAANSAYGAGVWAAGGVGDAPSWPAVGRPLAPTLTAETATPVIFDSADTVSADATTDLANVFGCLIYDDTVAAPVADQGASYNYFGGANSVVNGTFTVVWNASGILALTL